MSHQTGGRQFGMGRDTFPRQGQIEGQRSPGTRGTDVRWGWPRQNQCYGIIFPSRTASRIGFTSIFCHTRCFT
jgi:hypothetical protein